MAAGDAGAGGANLDYQAVGLLNYNFTPRWGAAVGWRYLYVNYRPTNNLFIFNTAMTGLVAGVSYSFGGKPAVPPTASCSVSPTEIWSGDPVTATINTQNFNPKHTITYAWTASGGRISAQTPPATSTPPVSRRAATPSREPQRMRRKRRTTSPAAKPRSR